ncbi:MAG: SDR family NAD(P)-dependent oxidoreductase [Pseudomonadota bacterium]
MQHAAITGASSGLGAAMAERLAQRGVPRLSLAGRSQERLERTVEACARHGAVAAPAAFDLSDLDALRAWLTEADAAAPLDLVIANAGVLASVERRGALEPPEALSALLRITLLSACATLAEGAALMRSRGRGRLAAISSLAALQPKPDELGYSAAKAGLNAYCEGMRAALQGSGLSLTLICPGFIATPMAEASAAPRLFEWSAERAAGRCVRAIEARRRFDAFPAPLLWAIRLGRLAPEPLRARLSAGFRVPE